MILTSRDAFEEALTNYRARMAGRHEQQANWAAEYLRFLSEDPNAFERSNPIGHFTGSGVVIDPYAGKMLLTHHAKTLCWVQLGGHCDGIRDPFFVAWKESYEEGGLKGIDPASHGIFDLDLHSIPEHKGVPEHLHYDVRYLFFADSTEGFVKSDESLDLAWADLGYIRKFSTSSSMLRLESNAIGCIEDLYGFERPIGYREPEETR
jgi:hypothetical protein